MASYVTTESRDGVLWIHLDRPDSLNAISRAMSLELRDVFAALEEGPERVGVVTGRGRAFCVGADLKEGLAEGFTTDVPIGGFVRGTRRKPVIAAINGPCLAGGLELALACDLRLAVPHATFGLPEVTVGLMPAAGGTQRLPRLVGPTTALELILTGAPIDAQRALAVGLLNAIVGPDELLDAAARLAARIAANAPLAVQAARRAVLEGADLPLEQGLDNEMALFRTLEGTHDFVEGPRAFVERRKPVFTGA